jgi:hypothetical protein
MREFARAAQFIIPFTILERAAQRAHTTTAHDTMIDHKLFDLVNTLQFAAAQKFLDSCDDDEAKKQIAKPVGYYCNALMVAVERVDTPERLIRSMIERGPHNYVNEDNGFGRTAAISAAIYSNATLLELLLTLGADPKGCRLWPLADHHEACYTVLDRFEQRTTLACCLRHYDELHQTSPLVLHPDIAALDPFAKILHDINRTNGDMHRISRTILSCI